MNQNWGSNELGMARMHDDMEDLSSPTTLLAAHLRQMMSESIDSPSSRFGHDTHTCGVLRGNEKIGIRIFGS